MEREGRRETWGVDGHRIHPEERGRRGTNPAGTLILDFYPPERCKITFMLFKPPQPQPTDRGEGWGWGEGGQLGCHLTEPQEAGGAPASQTAGSRERVDPPPTPSLPPSCFLALSRLPAPGSLRHRLVGLGGGQGRAACSSGAHLTREPKGERALTFHSWREPSR